MSKEINVKSSTIEKGLEVAKEFVSKLLGPTIEELGLLMADRIKYYRYKNQVNILIKAKNYVESKKLDVREIPTKILVPLLEQASLEEDEEMQIKWANLIGNLADSEQNLQNQIFPYLLGQISFTEYQELLDLNSKEEEFRQKKNELDTKIKEIKDEKGMFASIPHELNRQFDSLTKIEQEGFNLEGVEPYELANLERLGLIRVLPPQIIIDEFTTGGRYEEYGEILESHVLDVYYDTTGYDGVRITELGCIFIKLTSEK